MNEIIFLLYSISIIITTLGALRLGKEALVSLVVLNSILANLFVSKQITLFGLNATASDSLAIGATLSLNLIQEFYGKTQAIKTIWISFAAMLFYTLISQLHLAYLPNSFDTCHQAYLFILGNTPRILAASLSVYLVVQQLDTRLYAFLKKHYQGTPFLIRNNISIGCTQLLDTILFSFLGLYGIIDNIGQLIIFSYLIKLITILITTPFLALSKKITHT
jgi:queuosine precursor transporter